MTDNEIKDFIKTIQSINPLIENLEDAIFFALEYVPKVDSYMFFGEIKNGTFFANSTESRWFPNLSSREAALILAEEII